MTLHRCVLRLSRPRYLLAFGPSRHRVWVVDKRPFRGLFDLFGRPLTDLLEVSWGPLGGIFCLWGGILGHLGVSWGLLEGLLAVSGATLGGRVRNVSSGSPLGPLSGSSWGPSGSAWGRRGPFCDMLGFLDRLGRS